MNFDHIRQWIQQQDEELEYDPDGIQAEANSQWSLTFAPRPIITQSFVWIATDTSIEVRYSIPIPAVTRQLVGILPDRIIFDEL